MNILAVYTPAVGTGDTIRETFIVTATSAVSPTVRASGYSFVFGQNYQLNEGGGGFKVYLPIVLREKN